MATKLGMHRTTPQLPLKRKTPLRTNRGLNNVSIKQRKELVQFKPYLVDEEGTVIDGNQSNLADIQSGGPETLVWVEVIRIVFDEEKKLWKKGFKCVAGLDEAGRGPLAGPVVAAAVIVSDFDIRISSFFLRSKKHYDNVIYTSRFKYA